MITNFAKWFADRTYYRRKAARYEEKVQKSNKQYRELVDRLKVIELVNSNLLRDISHWQEMCSDISTKFSKVASIINAKGGQEFLDHGILPGQEGKQQFDDKELKTLISLCHPDKHSGRQSAVEITQKLLKLSGR